MKNYRVPIILAVLLLSTAGCSSGKEEAGGKQVESKEVAVNGAEWKESEYFTSEGLSLIGEPQVLGFTHSDSEEVKIQPNKTQKHGWHFWGEEAKTAGELTVRATKQGSDEQLEIVKNSPLGGPNSGADNHAPTNMTFPESGMWKLDAYLDDQLFGSVYVTVDE
ncbi:MAG: hypothetical protein ACI35R_09485 [Bacillus sp. (in: firmicutes)]